MTHKPIRFFTLAVANLAPCLVAAEPFAKTDTPVPASLNEAHAARIAGRYEQAIRVYGVFLDDRASRVEATWGLARCYIETGRYEQAEATLLEAEDLGRASADWHRTLAEGLSAVGRHERALEHCRKAIETDAGDLQARQLLGELYEILGRRDEAIKTYRFFERLVTRRLPADAAKLTATAKGFLRYSVLTRHDNLSNRTIHTLQELLQPAYTFLDRTYWPARLASADLLRSKFKNEQAAEDYKAALEINPNLAAAHVGLGRIALDDWEFEEAEKRIQLAKERNPNSVAALQLEAALRLAERRFELARDASESALTVNPHDVESLGLAAAAAFALDGSDAAERFSEPAYRVTSKPAAFHRVLADTLAALWQLPESERHYRLAIEADPTDPHPRTELGLLYMRTGDEDKARRVLTEAWELDEFDARTHRTLDLLDELVSFARHETEHFIIKYEAEHDALLPRYFADYLESVHQEVCDHYDWTPSDKTIVEFFPTKRMFAIRVSGKPWIRTVGACTGRVIAMASPRPSPQLDGPYAAADVLRHEFTHTVTLDATRYRINRWLTEGLAVMQEGRPRDYRRKKLLAEGIRRGELFTLESIDWKFLRPSRPRDVHFAYTQSRWMCEYIIERFGPDSIKRMLATFREKGARCRVVPDTFGLTEDRFDADFAAWARRQAAPWGFDLSIPEDVEALRAEAAQNPGDADLLARLAKAEMDGAEPERALETAESALEIDEKQILALVVLGKVLYEEFTSEEAERTRDELAQRLEPAMERLAKIAPEREIAPRALGRLALERTDHKRAIEIFERAMPLRPRHDDVLRGLSTAYLAVDNYERALPVLLELARTEETSPKTAAAIGMIYAREDRLGEARDWYLESVRLNPFEVATHEAYADVLMRLGETEAAAGEYGVLCELKPKQVKYFEQAAIAHHKLGNADSARKFARQAVALDSATTVRTLLPSSEQ